MSDDEEDEGMGQSRGDEFVRDVLDTSQFGRKVIQPSLHFERVFALFDRPQRVKFVEYVYRDSSSLGRSRPSLEAFVRDMLFDGEIPDELENDPNFMPRSDDDLVRQIQKYNAKTAAAIVRGEDHRGLARLLVTTLFSNDFTDASTFERFFAAALGSTILLPQQAAAVATCVAQSRVDFYRFEKEADYLLVDANIVRKEAFDDDESFERSRQRTSELRDIFEAYRVAGPQITRHQADVVRPDELFDRFKLEIVAGGLYVPMRKSIVLAKTMEEAIRMAESDKTSLLSMEPRRFEEFMAELFKRLGFEVELTQATRDGGADLLCLRDLNGIPIRLAVEIKRYKETRPIDVSLVRAFVGSNEQHKANQLVYVTTSTYTKPALDFAATCRPYFLSLKKYDQIREWCRAALAQPPRVL